MRLLSVTGWSNSGKTTLIVALIKHCVARGERVAAIKHTHHEVSDRNEGDTARFLEAGASIAILTNDDEAILWRTGASPVPIPPWTWTGEGACPPLDADVIFIEGFKSRHGWPRIEAPAELAEAIAILDRIAPP